jgi:hypothetical protein
MPDVPIRKLTTPIEEIRHEGCPPPAAPRRRAAAMALVQNQSAGSHVAELHRMGGLAASHIKAWDGLR